MCRGFVKALGCLEPEPNACPGGHERISAVKKAGGASWIVSVSNPSTGGRYHIWGSHWDQCACATALLLSSVPFSCYFPPISVLSSMASTPGIWASVVADRLTVWPLGASVEICSRDGDKECWEGNGVGNARYQSLLRGGLCVVTSTHFL